MLTVLSLLCCLVACESYSAASEMSHFYDDVGARENRAKHLEKGLPHHTFFCDLNAYVSCICDITGLGLEPDGTLAFSNRVLQSFAEDVMSDQFHTGFICKLLLKSKEEGDEYAFEKVVASFLFTAIPNSLQMKLNGMKTEPIEVAEQEAIITYNRHIRVILEIFKPKNQFDLWKNRITGHPKLFDEYIALQATVKKVRKSLDEIQKNMEEVLQRSLPSEDT